MASLRTVRLHRQTSLLFITSYLYAALWENMTSSTKPEVHNICTALSSEEGRVTAPHTCMEYGTEHFVKFEHVGFVLTSGVTLV